MCSRACSLPRPKIRTLRLCSGQAVGLSGYLTLKPPVFVKFHDMVSKMFRDILSNSGAVGREGKWETRSVFQGGSAAVFSSLCGRDRDPSRNDGRALDRGLELPDQGVAVIDLEASFDFEDLNPFPGQGATNSPLGVAYVQLALAVDLQHPGSLGIMPARRVGIVALRAGTPAAGRSLHVQGFVRTQIVVLPAIMVQPMLW